MKLHLTDKRRLLIVISCLLISVVLAQFVFTQIRNKAVSSSKLAARDYWPTKEWHTDKPENRGMDSAWLVKLDQRITGDFPHIYSVLVVRSGYLVFEKYYHGFHSEIPFEVASVTKSFTSALFGIALREKYIESIEQKLADFFPEYITPSTDPRVARITLRHLLTMTAGFDWSEEGPWGWPQGQNWMRYILNTPIAYEPGSRFGYNTPSIHLLSGVLTKQTGMSTMSFAERYLFKPLGIQPAKWLTDPQGFYNGGTGLWLTARAMAKFGYLYLNDGYWDGRQVIPADWVKASTQKQSEGGFPEHRSYGLLWWTTVDRGHPAYYAAGYGGQLIYVIPDLDVVVVITSDNQKAHPENKDLIGEYIVSAVVD